MSETNIPAEHRAWRRARWQDIAGPNGKAKIVANGTVIGRDTHVIAGVPGQWSTTVTGALTVTASAEDGVTVNGATAIGTIEVPADGTLVFPQGRVGFVTGSDGAYGLVVRDDAALAESGITGIDTYPYDPAWVVEGEYRAAPQGRRIEVGRLTTPRSAEAIPAPVDLAVVIDGTEYVLAVLEDSPGRRLVIFTDETNGSETPDIGRWLVLPLLDPGSALTVDFNRATLSYHHVNPAIFFCPLPPPGNTLPMRIQAGERTYVYDRSQDHRDSAITYLRHLENRDWTSARTMCSETATVWHNDGKGDQTVDENIAGMERQIGAIESMRYDITRQFSQPNEVLQQHVVNIATNDGARGQVHAAVYFRFEGGLITRIEEYANFVPATAAEHPAIQEVSP